MEVTKWEYISESGGVSDLNTLGQEGWECCGVLSNGTYILKRPSGRMYVKENCNGDEITSETKLTSYYKNTTLKY